MTGHQKAVLLQYMKEFLEDPNMTNEGESENFETFDEKRVASLPVLQSLVSDFAKGKISLLTFKEAHESKCREFPYWGFKGFSGQMQLNQFTNNIQGPEKESIFRDAVKL